MGHLCTNPVLQTITNTILGGTERRDVCKIGFCNILQLESGDINWEETMSILKYHRFSLNYYAVKVFVVRARANRAPIQLYCRPVLCI